MKIEFREKQMINERRNHNRINNRLHVRNQNTFLILFNNDFTKVFSTKCTRGFLKNKTKIKYHSGST